MSDIEIKNFKLKLVNLKRCLSQTTAKPLLDYVFTVAARDESDSTLLAHTFLLEVLAHLYQLQIKQFEYPLTVVQLQSGLEQCVDRPLPQADASVLILQQLCLLVIEKKGAFSVRHEDKDLVTAYQRLHQQMTTRPSLSCVNFLSTLGFFLGVISMVSLVSALYLHAGAFFIAALGMLGVSVTIAACGLLQESGLFFQERVVNECTYYSTVALK